MPKLHNRPFRNIASAPLNGTTVQVWHGPRQEVAMARWSKRAVAWMRDDDHMSPRALEQVTVWRPVERAGAFKDKRSLVPPRILSVDFAWPPIRR